jgi:hypothetical protein
VWRLVERTKASPKFARNYNFPSYEKGWIRTSRLTPAAAAAAAAASGAEAAAQRKKKKKGSGKKAAAAAAAAAAAVAAAAGEEVQPRLLALDCEMCVTTKSGSALLSLAVVDASGAVVMQVSGARNKTEHVDTKDNAPRNCSAASASAGVERSRSSLQATAPTHPRSPPTKTKPTHRS